MKRLFWRVAPEMVLCVGIVGVLGCDPNNGVAAGPPVLQSLSVIDNLTGAPLDLTADGSPVQISGFVHLSALFDRLLDPTAVATLDGGVDLGTTDAVSATYAPALMPGAAVTLTSIYTPNGDSKLALVFAPGPTITTTPGPTFPSASTVTVTLSKTKIRSKKGEPFVDGDSAAGTIMFQTLPFMATIAVPMGDADPDAGADAGTPSVSPMMQPVTISFTNLPADDIADHISIIANGTPVVTGITRTSDGAAPTTITFTPDIAWPANATIEVRVDATAADAVAVPIDAPASASFTTSAS